jgi:hypothetical protein
MARSITLELTEAGRKAMIAFLARCTPGSIVALEWLESDSSWRVGAFNQTKVPASEVVMISGIPFVFLPKDLQRLNGRTLDHRGGIFCVD